MNKIENIKSNAAGNETTFIGKLHEEAYWDMKLFLSLIDSINLSSEEKDRGLINIEVNKINSYILNSIINNLNPNDGYSISNFNEIELIDVLERLNVIVSSFFKGEKVEESIFDDDLRKI